LKKLEEEEEGEEGNAERLVGRGGRERPWGRNMHAMKAVKARA